MRKVIKAAAAATVLLAGGAACARAADMLPPAYQLEPEPLVEFGSGWYLRGDLGYVTVNRPSYGHSVTDPYTMTTTSSGPLIGDPMQTQGIFGTTLGVGYAFNSWFRTDVTFDWRENLSGSFSESFTPSAAVAGCVITDTVTSGVHSLGYTSCYKTDKTQIRSWTTLVNAYADLGTWYGITPYIGGGIGLSNLRTSTGENWYFANGTGYSYNGLPNTWCPNGSSGTCYSVGYAGAMPATSIRNNFSFALMAGFAYAIAPHLKLDIGYRYLNMGTIGVLTASGQVAQRTMDTQEVRAGLRWTPDL